VGDRAQLAQEARTFVTGRSFSEVLCNTLTYWAYIKDTKKTECCEYGPWPVFALMLKSDLNVQQTHLWEFKISKRIILSESLVLYSNWLRFIHKKTKLIIG
jgi:hypothetical protein